MCCESTFYFQCFLLSFQNLPALTRVQVPPGLGFRWSHFQVGWRETLHVGCQVGEEESLLSPLSSQSETPSGSAATVGCRRAHRCVVTYSAVLCSCVLHGHLCSDETVSVLWLYGMLWCLTPLSFSLYHLLSFNVCKKNISNEEKVKLEMPIFQKCIFFYI